MFRNNFKANKKSKEYTVKSKFILGPYHQFSSSTFANFLRVSIRARTHFNINSLNKQLRSFLSFGLFETPHKKLKHLENFTLLRMSCMKCVYSILSWIFYLGSFIESLFTKAYYVPGLVSGEQWTQHRELSLLEETAPFQPTCCEKGTHRLTVQLRVTRVGGGFGEEVLSSLMRRVRQP